MTEEICAKCGYEESEHYHLTDGVYCPRYVKELGLPCEKFKPKLEICEECGFDREYHPCWIDGKLNCKKFKPQNHNPQSLSETPNKKQNEDTESEEASPRKTSGSGSLSDKKVWINPYNYFKFDDVKEAVKKLKKGFREFGNKENIYKFIDKIFGRL